MEMSMLRARMTIVNAYYNARIEMTEGLEGELNWIEDISYYYVLCSTIEN